MPGAAFFDLDRTLISRSSSLALARPFRERGLIGRGDVLKATLAQAFFARFGAGHGRVGQTADSAMSVLEGISVETVNEIAADAWQPVLRPLVYREALAHAEAHAARGEDVYIATAALQEVADEVARRLGFAGALGSRAEIDDGIYTGRLERRLSGAAKADAVRSLATSEGADLAGSTAYSDSFSDLPFLEAVGTAVIVNPDRRLARVAAERGWVVERFRRQAFPDP